MPYPPSHSEAVEPFAFFNATGCRITANSATHTKAEEDTHPSREQVLERVPPKKGKTRQNMVKKYQ